MKLNKYIKRTWTDPRLKVGKSRISGKGVIAQALIKKGETIMIWGGVKISKKNMDDGKYRLQSLVPIDDETYLGLPAEDTAESIDEYLNHSCDPNAWLVDEVTIVARKNIRKGEEITLDCATWDADEE